eukprot:g16553.t1
MGVNASSPAPTGPGSQLDGARVRVAVKERYHGFLPKYINRHATVSEEKVRLAAQHWNFIADENDSGMQDAGMAPSRISVFYDAFYHKLFEKLPEAKGLFDGNMVRQSRALVKMVSWLCNLEVTDDLVSRLEALADRHVEYGCLPPHYEAGGDALQYALRATLEDQDPAEAKAVMNAWRDLYSFVILIVIPRTALRLDESVRSAGPVSTMLRPTPISGTRLKVLATTPPPRINNASTWQRPVPRGDRDHHGGGGARSRASSGSVAPTGSSRRLTEHLFSMGTPNTAAATPAAGEEEQQHTEWFGTGGRAPGVSRSGSASSVARTSSGRRRRRKASSRSGPHRLSDTLPARSGGGDGGGAGGEQGSRFDILGAPWTGGAGGGGGHNLVAPYADGQEGEEDGMYTPGDSPLSTTSSMASGLHLSLVGSVATTTGVNSACVSPDGSAVGPAGRGAAQGAGGGKGEGRRSKLLRGLGRLSGVKGGGDDASSGRISSSSPRGPTIGARARAVLSGRPKRHTDSTAGGRHRAPARHGRSSSIGGGPTMTAVGAGWGHGGGGAFSGALGASPRGSDASGFQPQRRHPEKVGIGVTSNINGSGGGSGGNGGGAPALASPAGSSLSLPSSRSSWDKSGAVVGRSRGAGGGGGGPSSRKRPTRVAVAPTARTPTSATLSRPDYGWLEGCSNSNSGGGGDAQKKDERTPRSRRMSPTGVRDATFSGVGDNRDGGHSTITASTGSPLRCLATDNDVASAPLPGRLVREPPAATTAVAETRSLPHPVNSGAFVESTTLSHPAHGRDDGGGGKPVDRKHSGGGNGLGREREGELHIHAIGDGPFEEPLPVTPDVDDARVLPRLPPSPTESRTGSRRVARRSESGSRSISRRRRHAETNSAREKIRAERLERKAELDQDGVFSDDDEVFGEGGVAGSGEAKAARRPAPAETKRGGAKGRSGSSSSSRSNRPSRQPPARKLSHEAAQMFGFLDDDNGGPGASAGASASAGGNTATGAPRRCNSRDRSNGSDVGVVDSIGANALAYFHKRLDQSQGSGSWGGDDGGDFGGSTGRREGGVAAGGGSREREAAEEAAAEEKKQVVGEARALPRKAQQQPSSQQKQRAGGTDATTRADNEQQVEGKGADGSKEAHKTGDGLLALSAARAPISTINNSRSPVYADRKHSPTPEELAAMQAGAFSGHATAWQATEAIVTTPPRRHQVADVTASSPPHCPSPFFAARRSSPFAGGGSKTRSRAGTGGSSSSNGDSRHATNSKPDPSSAWCATTRAADTPATALTPARAAVVSVCTAATAANNTLSPPMWKPSRPIVVPGQAPPSSATAASVLPAYFREGQALYNTPPASPPPAASARASGVDADEAHSAAATLAAATAVVAGRGGDAHGGRPTAAVEGAEVFLVSAAAPTVTAVVPPGGTRSRSSSVELPSAIRIQPQQGQNLPEHFGLVRKSENTPMSLPPMDGSVHAPQADDVGGATMPASGSRKERKHRVVTPSSSARRTGADGLPDDGGSEEDSAVRQTAAAAATATMTMVSAATVTADVGTAAAAAAATDALPSGLLAADPKTVMADSGTNVDEEGNRRHDLGDREHVGGGRTGVGAAADAVQGNGEAPRTVVAASVPGGMANGWAAGSFAVPIVGGKSVEAVRARVGVGAEHGTVIAAGTVKSASERWGGARATSSKTPALREMERRAAAAEAAAAAAVAEEERSTAMAAAETAASARVASSAPAGGVRGTRQGGLSSDIGRVVNGSAKTIDSGVTVKRRGSTGGAIENTSARGAGRDHQLRSTLSSVNADTARPYEGAPLAPPPSGSGGGGSKPKGWVAAMAASFGNRGRGGVAANPVPARGVGTNGGGGGGGGGHAGAVQVADGGGASGGGTAGRGGPVGAQTSAPAGGGGGGDGHAKYGGDGVERRKGPMDGLSFGNVRQKANAWGVPLRS